MLYKRDDNTINRRKQTNRNMDIKNSRSESKSFIYWSNAVYSIELKKDVHPVLGGWWQIYGGNLAVLFFVLCCTTYHTERRII
jgi:hypothetical protein